MVKGRNILVVWIGALCVGLPVLAQESDDRFAEPRRAIHAELPPDANLYERLHGPVPGQIHVQEEGLDTPCPCRGAFVDEDPSEDPLPALVEHVGLGFGSAVLVFLAVVVGRQVYAARRSG
jgi:hypothetical protein